MSVAFIFGGHNRRYSSVIPSEVVGFLNSPRAVSPLDL